MGLLTPEAVGPRQPDGGAEVLPADTKEQAPTTGRRALSMVSNSVSLMGGKAGTMALGFLFWLLAARAFDPAEVGLAAGAVSAMMLCTQISIFGIGSAVINDLGRYGDHPRRLLDTAFTIVLATSVLAGGLFLVVASSVFEELSVIGSIPLFTAFFLVMCVLGTLGILFDQVSIALRRGDQVLVRGLVFGGVTVALIVVLPDAANAESALAVFSPWVVAGAAACALGVVQLWRTLAGYRYRPGFERVVAARLVRVSLPNYALTLTERAPGLILPIVVTELLSPEANASWYAVWMMAWVIFIIPISVGLALFAEGANRPDALPAAVRQGIRAALAIGLVGAATLAALAPSILSLLGETYAATGATPLRILVWAFVPLVFVQTYFAACRAREQLREAIWTGVVSGVVAVSAATVAGVLYGLDGMAIAWVAVQAATGVWALVRVRSFAGPRAAATASPSFPTTA
ncbi:MAG: lipopolysaccharide biosynthesis protein [Actinomycetota bacterium]|nr:lipopolysaccharide biosynthesis protein [Actinomycetota bacterium]